MNRPDSSSAPAADSADFAILSALPIPTLPAVSKHSLYSSFGDKEALFLAAVDHYQAGKGSIYDIAVNEGKTAKAAFTNLFKLAAIEMTRSDQPRGCMLAVALPTCSPKYDKLQKELQRLRPLSETTWVTRLQAAVQSKEIPESTDLHLLATFMRTTLLGMSLQARAGASRETLMKIGKLALQDRKSVV